MSFDSLKEVDVWSKMNNSMFLILRTYFLKLRLPCKPLCLECLLTFFFPTLLFFIKWWTWFDSTSPGLSWV